MKTKIIIGVVILLLSIFLYWYFIVRFTKEKSIKLILNSGMAKNEEFLKTADDEYLINWAKAIDKGKDTFTVNDKNYNTNGGRGK